MTDFSFPLYFLLVTQNISEQILSLISAAQKLVIQIRQSTQLNNTFDISAVRTPEEGKNKNIASLRSELPSNVNTCSVNQD